MVARKEQEGRVTIPYSVPITTRILKWGSEGFRGLVGGTWQGVVRVKDAGIWVLKAATLKKPKN